MEDPTQDPTDSAELAGRWVGNSYRLVRPIGQGATGTVWQGEDRATKEKVAVKLLHESLLRQPRLVTRFVQERTILLMLRHRNVVRVRDLFSVGETLGLVMDLVAGGSLRDHLERERTMAPAEAARLAAQVADALAEAHELGIIHRDLKPDNILVLEKNGKLETRLTDFGIARILTVPSMTTPNAVVGTPHYMAPEAFHGVTPSPATDVYALGVLLYELVSGQPPYLSDSVPELMRMHAESRPYRRSGVPDELWRIIRACLSAKPKQRPAAPALVRELRMLSRKLAGIAPLPPPPPPSLAVADPDDMAVEPPELRSAIQLPRGGRHAVPRARKRNDVPGHRWARPGAAVAVIAGVLIASGVATSVWRRPPLPETLPNVTAISVPPRPAAASATPRKTKKKVKPAPVRTKRAVQPHRTRSPQPERQAYGPWECAQGFVFDLSTRSPLVPRSCHSVGRGVQFQASLTAPAGGHARIEVTLRDADTGRTVGGPTTCADLTFTPGAMTKACGPGGARPRKGRSYTVVMAYRYERGGRTSASTARGRVFTW
ncbi:serine/threonine-protein kinase [Actinoplanes awajinensis]|uniref:Serine/threonine protein kinase n=1 Tax=Actinoplanes awajinensis subsp. mycoplanecinus TaxID=135947 RepID=A0A101JTA7_9ACTN|nr:serine/threonine-protein kinase [Actinoplanes awajinensis]KUL32627.1 serine/threonine protein kinase [Actinoplanes awajinensis subsp. mycoplanecinus]